MTPDGSVALVATLRRLMRPQPAEFCELCGARLTGAHTHIVDLHTRRLLCACGMCAAIDDPPGRGRYRRVPARFLHLPSMTISEAQWDALAIPVDLAFFFFNTHLGRIVGLYPGPAGATESQLSLDAWSMLEAANPWIGTMAPDVEALLVRRRAGGYSCFIVPIDACYELAGRIRSHWTGMTGGTVVQNELDEFFASVMERSGSPLPGARQ